MAIELTWNEVFPDQPSETPRLIRVGRFVLLFTHLAAVWLASAFLGGRLQDERRREHLLRRWSRRLLSALNVQVRVKGTPVPPGQPVLFVANHVSWLDIQALNSLDGARPVAKSEVRDWPIVGTVAARSGAFFIRRGSWRDAGRVKDAVAAALRSGGRASVFPEATTTDGTKLKFFYAAFLQAAIDAGALVQPVAIRYPGENGAPNPAPAFIGDLTFMGSLLRILREPKLQAEITFGDPISPAGKTRRQLAAKAQRLIALDLGIPLARMDTKYVPFQSAALANGSTCDAVAGPARTAEAQMAA
jgi:1-acyl-sn-glycerol-3-phosphate acyltransferase